MHRRFGNRFDSGKVWALIGSVLVALAGVMVVVFLLCVCGCGQGSGVHDAQKGQAGTNTIQQRSMQPQDGSGDAQGAANEGASAHEGTRTGKASEGMPTNTTADATNPADVVSGTSPQLPASGLILTENAVAEVDPFALWIQGRLAITDPVSGVLLFEADPSKSYLGIWSSMGVDENLVVRGRSDLARLHASGFVSTGSDLQVAGDVTVGGAVTATGDITATGDVEAGNVTAKDVKAAGTFSVQGDISSATSITSPHVTAQEAALHTVNVQVLNALQAVLDVVGTKSLTTTDLESSTITVDTLDGSQITTDVLDATDATAGSLVATDATLESLTATDATVNTLTTTSITTDVITGGTLAATLLKGVFLGSLRGLDVEAPNSGCVVFGGIGEDGTGFVPAQEITVPSTTTAIFLQASASGGDWVCAWGTRRISQTVWSVECRYPKAAIDEMSQGRFEPVEPVTVYWLAVTVVPLE